MFEKYQFDPKICKAVGCPNKAFIIEFILWSINDKEEKSKSNPKAYSHLYHEGRWFMWDTHEAWNERLPWLSLRTIKKYMADLKASGWIITAKLGVKEDRTLFYSVNKQKYAQCRSCTHHSAEPALSECRTCTMVGADSALSSLSNTLTKTPTKTHKNGNMPKRTSMKDDPKPEKEPDAGSDSKKEKVDSILGKLTEVTSIKDRWSGNDKTRALDIVDKIWPKTDIKYNPPWNTLNPAVTKLLVYRAPKVVLGDLVRRLMDKPMKERLRQATKVMDDLEAKYEFEDKQRIDIGRR